MYLCVVLKFFSKFSKVSRLFLRFSRLLFGF